jgi:hypothetical protein
MYASALRNTREMGSCLSVSILHKAEYTAVGSVAEGNDNGFDDDSSEQDVLIFTIPSKTPASATQDGLRERIKQGVFK